MRFNFNIILIGGGDSCVEIVDYILTDTKFDIKKFHIRIYDDDFKNQKYFKKLSSKIILKKKDKLGFLKNDNAKALITFGKPELRDEYNSILFKKKIKLFKLIHSTAYVSKTAKINPGSVICPMAVVGSFAQIKDNVYINSAALIGHHSIIKKNTTISPNCFFGGNSKIGSNGFVGAGANIYPGVEIKDYCKIAAGSSVTKNIPKGSLAYGNPAVYFKNK